MNKITNPNKWSETERELANMARAAAEAGWKSMVATGGIMRTTLALGKRTVDLAPRGERMADLHGRMTEESFHRSNGGGTYSTWCEPEHRPALGAVLVEADKLTRTATRTALAAALDQLGIPTYGGKRRDLALRLQLALIDAWCPWHVVNAQ